MKRKIVKQGEATLMVSLPSKWAKRFNLKKGQEVNIEEVDNNLVISKDDAKVKKEIKIKLTKPTESLIQVSIINAYRAGYDIIKIDFEDPTNIHIINNTINDFLIGFEMIRREGNSCALENITEPSEEQFDILFRKIIYNISLSITNTEERLRNKTKFEDYKDITLKIHQYDNFCRRVIAKKNYVASKAGFYWSFLSLIGHGQRELYHINRYLDKNKVEFKNFEFFKEINKIFELLKEGYFKKDISKLEKLHEMEREIIYNKFYNLIQKYPKEGVILYHAAVTIRKFYLATSPLLGLLYD